MPSENPVRRMPAEWTRHEATWLSWPHNEETWPGVLAAAEQAMTDVVAALAPHERVLINVVDDTHRSHVADLLRKRVPMDRVDLELIPTDDAWIRDYGAIVVETTDSVGGRSAIDFDYNAWGGKYPPFDRDRAVGRQMASRLALPRVEVPIVFEGGSIDVNGRGIGIVTEQCLLNPNRNPTFDRHAIETILDDCLGVSELIWLGDGIIGDDTDGHVDNLARFVGEARVVALGSRERGDPDHSALVENLRRLREYGSEAGRLLEVVELPRPAPLDYRGRRLPASYANFYIANDVVLMPAFGGSADAEARATLADCFPERQVVAIDCRALIVGLGALHCLTQQIPVIVPAHAAQQQ